MRTNKDENWLTAGFGNIVDVKKIIGKIFDNYKLYWAEEVPEWDYEIREIEIAGMVGDGGSGIDAIEYIVEIFCGLKTKVCVMRQRTVITDRDFAKTSYAMLDVWEKTLTEIGTAGAVKLYMDTVTLHRKNGIESNGVNYKQNPLTITEAYMNKNPAYSTMKNEQA